MNKILCPVDFSKASLVALEFATRIAEKHSSSILLVHVITEEEYNIKLDKTQDDILEKIKTEVENKLQVLMNEINVNTWRDYDICSFRILYGDLDEQIINLGEEESMALIVMGTDGASDISEERMGSNTVKVISGSNIPVLSVPGNAAYSDFKRIVYGSELSEEDKMYLRQVINFAIPFDSRIYLIHVSEHEDRTKSIYAEYVEKIKSYFDYRKLSVEEFVTSEEVAIALEHTLNVHDANLLVLVHKSRNFLESLFHKSLTKKMSYLTNFPLLALRN